MNDRMLRGLIKTWAFLLIGFSLGVGLWVRFFNLAGRMTHVDDIGLLGNLKGAQSMYEASVNIIGSWTYGPMQYKITWLLIQSAKNFDQLVALARLPSAVFSALMLLMLVVLWRAWKAHWSIGFFMVTVAGCSLHSIIDAQQAYPYASTTFYSALCAVVIALSYRLRKQPRDYGILLVGWGLTNWIVLPASYQNLLLLPGTFLGLATVIFSEIYLSRKFKLWWIQIACITAVLLISLYKAVALYKYNMIPLKLAGYASLPGWAIEETRPSSLFAVEWVGYLWRRFENLTFYQLSPVWPDLLSPYLIGFGKALLALLILFGMIYVIFKNTKRPDIVSIALLIFSSVPILAMATLNYLNEMPFGATRHSQILMVPLVIIFAVIVNTTYLGKAQKVARSGVVVVAGAICVIFLARYSYFNGVTSNRYDLAAVDDACRSTAAGELWELGVTWNYDLAKLYFPEDYSGCTKVQRMDVFDKKTALAYVADGDGPRVVLVTSQIYHLAKIFDQETLERFRGKLKFEVLAELSPLGSTEPIGNINGGNGFYLTKISKLSSE
jgi:hypothetical protein